MRVLNVWLLLVPYLFSRVSLHLIALYIYIYIYIVIYGQTVSLYHNSSVCLDTRDASSWVPNPPDFNVSQTSYSKAIVNLRVSEGIFLVYIYMYAIDIIS